MFTKIGAPGRQGLSSRYKVHINTLGPINYGYVDLLYKALKVSFLS